MLTFRFKLIWCIFTIIGTLISLAGIIAFGSVVRRPWSPLFFCFGLILYQGSFCLGLIWRMDPFKMPRAFCIAQAILMSAGVYILGGLCTVLCIATNLHAVKPKQWGDIHQAFKWRRIYVLPIIVYPLLTCTVYFTLALKYNAIQPAEGMFCDATSPMWVQVVGHALPAAILFVPCFWLSIISFRRVLSTKRHVKRARRDENEVTRQIRRDRPFQLSEPPAVLNDNASPSPSRDLPPAETSRSLSFRIPFIRQPSRTLSPPPSPNSPADGRASVASSSFPTFAPIDKPGHAKDKPDGGPDIADRSSPWLDEEDSCAPTSIEGHETSDVLELVKTQNEDEDGTFRLSYRENARTPSRVSHLTQVPAQAPQIQLLILVQISFPICLVFYSLSSIVEIAIHRHLAFGTQNVLQIASACGPGIVFLGLPSVRTQLVKTFAFWRGRG
ncbi:hypothetical protein C8F04DRAFT_280335 [Mycena alexandri]|uniref:Uncharacterized protein n=1 Tax=Mycena alexandri TaxID=1745969 RepID=A0AAD6T5W3_9AGAR|nr:hypothetical protein C8F04DRAFT_280335 [Mycena alexandri]